MGKEKKQKDLALKSKQGIYVLINAQMFHIWSKRFSFGLFIDRLFYLFVLLFCNKNLKPHRSKK